MIFLLISFLALSLIVTLVGLVLSARNRVEYPAERVRFDVAGPVRVRSSYRTVEPVRARRYWQEDGLHGDDVSWGARLLGGVYRRADGSTNWTTTIITLIGMFLLGLYLLVGLLPGHAFIGYIPFYGNPAPSGNSTSQKAPEVYGASAALVRIGQLNAGQYDTAAEYNTWAMSACSAASMTEVINAYGHHYRVIDILKVESQLGEITPQLGLVESIGIQRTVAQFGFKTTWGNNFTLDQVISIANQGRPVIVDFPPSKYAGGHLLVVTGGNANYVYLADSSIFDRRVLTRSQFMQWWAGFAAIVTPQ